MEDMLLKIESLSESDARAMMQVSLQLSSLFKPTLLNRFYPGKAIHCSFQLATPLLEQVMQLLSAPPPPTHPATPPPPPPPPPPSLS